MGPTEKDVRPVPMGVERSMNKIRLSILNAYEYRGVFHYIATHDTSSGRANCYTLMIKTSKDPVTIGRELTLGDIRTLIVQYESDNQAIVSFGYREDALAALDRYSNKEKTK